jgi:glycosyltransferase involved in cell wall biosynthesis
MISVLILTRNEEKNLAGCLDSVDWSDDVHVYDSFSTDRTVAIARARGATVTQREFDNFATQRNSALHGLPFRHRWVLILDADERIPAPLQEEMLLALRGIRPEVAACRMRRRDFLNGTWLKYSQLSPYYIRLVQPSKVRYERAVNEVLKVDGEIRDLREPFDHFPFFRGISHWIDKHNLYSSMEASLANRSRHGGIDYSIRKAFFARDFNERRFHQKELFYRLPFRPFIKFFLIYVLRRGFLDGRAGFDYAMLQAIYEYFITVKSREIGSLAPENNDPALVPGTAGEAMGARSNGPGLND